MSHRQVVDLVREIRDVYAQSCELAARFNQRAEDETLALRNAYRARPQKRIPELEHFESVFDRRDAMRRAMTSPALRFRQHAFAAATWLGIFVCTSFVVQSAASPIAGIAVTAALGITAIIVHQRLVVCSEPLRRNLREQLVARGVPVCVACGYDLRGQVGQAEMRCPECGAPAVHLVELPRGQSRVRGGIAHVG